MKILILLATATLAIGASYALNLDKAQPPESRIVNGIEASTTDVPYQVGLLVYNLDGQGSSRCGGALISETVVLTAAHCFTNKQKRGWAFLGTNKYGQGTQVQFNTVTVHEKFNTYSKQNDIALVHLDRVVKPNGSTIKIIELDKSSLEENTEITVSGYGLTSATNLGNRLYYTEMIVRNKDVCGVLSTPLVDSMVCAKGVNGKETCPGDSGGPVVRNWPNNPTHVALVSFGGGCQTNYPKVFTRTASFIHWIEKHM